MFRNFKGIIFVIILLVLGLIALLIPQIKIGSFERGESGSLLGLRLGLDLQGGTHLVYKFLKNDDQPITNDDIEGVKRIVEKRVNEFGLSEPNVQLLGNNPPDRILIQLPGQKGVSLTISFNGGTVNKSALDDFFTREIGLSSYELTENDDGSFYLQFSADKSDENIDKNTIEDWKEKASSNFPVNITFGYSNIEEDDLEKLPQLFNNFSNLSSGELKQINDFENGFSVDIFGIDYKENTGAQLNSQLKQIQDDLKKLGKLQFFIIQGNILQWTLSGGIQEAKRLIGSTAMLEFRYRECGDLDIEDLDQSITAQEWEIERCINPIYYTEIATEIKASDLVDAYPDISPELNRPIVQIVFNDEGADAFYKATDRIAREDDRLAVYLDDEELVAPYASTGIAGGRAFIEGPGFTSEITRTIAIQLRSGALPLGLELVQERNVDSVLGEDSLKRSLIAAGIGLVLLLIFMIVYYKLPGIVAILALLSYGIILLAIFKTVPVVLTLSGAAAVILSLGFAVDANILIAERTKEEIHSGRGLLAAINSGFDRAWPSIRDGNLSTIIVAVVLFWFGDRFGTSIMQGFALTLAIGVSLSMFTAFFASRLFLRLVASSFIGKKITFFVPVSDQVDGEKRK
ncbi:MAG: protein translocase subunit SecD [Chloroflexi bacterium]|nr:protein translocase subunit SecD [Chloroflexota bacterium]